MKTFGTRFLSAAGIAALVCTTVPTRADALPVLGAPLYASGGEVTVRFEGSDASYHSLIAVNGSAELFPNYATASGTEFSLGDFAVGTALDVVLHVLNNNTLFHSGPGLLNSDGLAHAMVSIVGGRAYVSFEDRAGGGDKDYNDHMFSFTNVQTTAVPEPTSVAFMFAGLGVLGFLAARVRRR